VAAVVVALLALPPGLTEVARGRLSVYWPGDGLATGSVLACDTPRRPRRYRRGSVHVAMRGIRRGIPCGTVVVVCSGETGRCVPAPVLDAGPWGIVRGRRWRVWTNPRPPPGWRFRSVVDVSREVWRRLGKPDFLSRVRIYRRADVL
jgi:hypothetical protein